MKVINATKNKESQKKVGFEKVVDFLVDNYSKNYLFTDMAGKEVGVVLGEDSDNSLVYLNSEEGKLYVFDNTRELAEYLSFQADFFNLSQFTEVETTLLFKRK